jgi:ATP adenylyltransferase/5',5'''-P-1,P-4-tetraphosphate phosphorylase II
VKDLTPSHFLAFNGFSSYRPHFLLLTSDGYKRQWEALDIHDFTAVSAFLESAIAAQGGKGSDYLIFYNCRAEAGCSRVHKHLQAIPRESFDGNPWLNFDENPDAVPFAYHSDTTCGTDPAALLAAYQTGMQAVERTLGKETKLENGVPPHNMLMDRGRLVVIPRRAGGIEPLAANSGGMLGMIWTQSEEMMQRWLDVDPHKLLAVAGVPKLL